MHNIQSLQPGTTEPLDWHFGQVFGERTPGEEVQDGKSVILALNGPKGLAVAPQPAGGCNVVMKVYTLTVQ